MGRLKDYFKSFLGIPDDPLRPNDIPRNIHEDFSHQFGHTIPQQPGPTWQPEVEWHIFQDEGPDDHDYHVFQGEDMFSQMEQMFESFFQGFPFSSPELFNGPRMGIDHHPSLLDDGTDQQHQPPTNPDEPGCLRDKMLKQPDSDIQDHFRYSEQDQPSPHSWFGGLWNSPFDNLHQPQEKVDKDLDSELESGHQSLDDILSNKQDPDRTLIPAMPRSSSQSYSSITTIDSLGVCTQNTESKTTRRDGSGREEVTITRKSGDQEHTIKTWKNEDGSEQSQENVINIDQEKLPEFNDRWRHSKEGSRIISSDDRPPMSSIYENVIDQFFGPRR